MQRRCITSTYYATSYYFLEMMINSINLLLAGLSVLASASAVAPAVTFLSFESGNSDQAAFERAAGSFTSEISNPLTNDSVNPSSLVGRYIRNPAIVWDWSLFSTSAITDASLYLDGDLVFEMDVLTYDAEIGTQIDITIEDTTITATQDYPSGRHSRYTAVTSVQGEWERLTFSKLDQPDASVANDGISAILISYAPGQSVSGTFYVDNLVAVAASTVPSTPPPTAAPSPSVNSPAPTKNPTPQPTSSPSPIVATVAKFICAKNEPIPSTICSEGSVASGKCTTEGQLDGCGKGKKCWWNTECPGGDVGNCSARGTSCSQNSDCCSGDCPRKGKNPYHCK